MLTVLLVDVVAAESEDVDLGKVPMVDVCEKCTLRRIRLESDDGEESSHTGTTDASSISPLAQAPLFKHVQEVSIFPMTSTAEHAPISSMDSIRSI